jgi:hemerythrin-like domain-containing protein
MKIIDTKTGTRLDADGKAIASKLKEVDPLKRDSHKGDELSEHSPMDPPDAYDEEFTSVEGIKYEDLTSSLKNMIGEHNELNEHAEKFEKALGDFHDSSYMFTKAINERFNSFFKYFDDHILPHNRKEERHLFPILHKRLIESGEHSPGEDKETAIDLMEDDHVKFIQLASLTFNLLGLASRLPDNNSRAITFDLAYHNGKELIELLRLHIYREDNTIFPLAQKLLSIKELNYLDEEIDSFRG